MKIRWKTNNKRFRKYILSVVACMVMPFTMQAIVQVSAQESYRECVSEPVVDDNIKEYVRDYQMSVAKSLVKAGFEVEMMRHREVIVVIIPTHRLFTPGSDDLSPKGVRRLHSVVPYLGAHGLYKIVVAGYADNTGSPAYCLKRSGKQAMIVADWLRGNTEISDIVEFGMGSESPLLPNNTVANRAINRRIEILLVPAEGLLSRAGR